MAFEGSGAARAAPGRHRSRRAEGDPSAKRLAWPAHSGAPPLRPASNRALPLPARRLPDCARLVRPLFSSSSRCGTQRRPTLQEKVVAGSRTETTGVVPVSTPIAWSRRGVRYRYRLRVLRVFQVLVRLLCALPRFGLAVHIWIQRLDRLCLDLLIWCRFQPGTKCHFAPRFRSYPLSCRRS